MKYFFSLLLFLQLGTDQWINVQDIVTFGYIGASDRPTAILEIRLADGRTLFSRWTPAMILTALTSGGR